MKTLIKIRAMYLKKNPCELFWSYLSVGVIMLIVGIINIMNILKERFTFIKMDLNQKKLPQSFINFCFNTYSIIENQIIF